MTQQELAKSISISDSYLSQIESGKRTPTLDTIRNISSEFGIPISSIMFFSEQLGAHEGGVDRASRMAFGKRLLAMLSRIERTAQ